MSLERVLEHIQYAEYFQRQKYYIFIFSDKENNKLKHDISFF